VGRLALARGAGLTTPIVWGRARFSSGGTIVELAFFVTSLLAAVAFLGLVMLLLAYLGGWRRLARSYRFAATVPGKTWWFEACEVGGLGYNGCLIVTAGDVGMQVGLWWVFNTGHPRLLFPWDHVSVRRRKVLWGMVEQVEMRLVLEPSVSFCISPRLAAKIRAEVGPRWPEAAVTS
jgi:hypothetical protein